MRPIARKPHTEALVTLTLSACLLLVGAASAQFGVLDNLKNDYGVESFENDGSLQVDGESGNIVASGNIHLVMTDIEVFANKAVFNNTTQSITFTDDVSIYKNDGFVYRGKEATYNSKTGAVDAASLRSSMEPIFFEAGDFETATEDMKVVNLGETIFTTHDNANYNYHLKAKNIQIYPDDRVVMRNVVAYAGKMPVLYFPYISQTFDEELGYSFTPGYRSNWGGFLANRYGVQWGDHSIIQYKLDIRSKRGVAGGFDLISRRHRDNENFGKFQFYYAQDTNPTEALTGSASDRNDIDNSRYRINLQHRVYLPGPEESTFYVDFDLNKLSDEFFYEDFFPSEFRLDPNPDNLINIVKQTEHAEISLLGRFRVNDFFQTDTRSPELSLDNARTPIKDTGLFHTGNTSFGIYSEDLATRDERDTRNRLRRLEDRLDLDEEDRPPNFDEEETLTMMDDLRDRLSDVGFKRMHTYHEILFPKTYGGWLSVTPRVGVGFTNYSSIDGPSPVNSSRTLLHAGLEASYKATKTYGDIQWPKLGVDGIRHIAQPYVNWSLLEADELGDEFNRVDRLVPSTRVRPLNVPEFTAIDDLRSWNIARVGMYNRFYTRRDSRSHLWLSSNTYVQAFIEDPEFDRNVSNLYQEIRWSPLPWLRVDLDAQIPIGGGEFSFSEFNTRIAWMPTDSLEMSVGHRLLKDHPFFEDSNQIDLRAYARLGENWGLSLYQRYEMEDSSLQIQQYSIHRDLASWTAALGAVIRENSGGQDDYGVVFSLTLKDFPQVSIPLDLDPNPNGDR